MSDHPAITGIYRYPVKGLNADRLDEVDLEAGKCIPFDRAWAIENGGRLFDPENPEFLPKNRFLMLMSHERLARLDAHFDEQTQTLSICRDGKQVATGRLYDRLGRQLLEQFLSAYMADELRGAPRIVHAAGHSFADVPTQYLSMINLASVRELERVVGKPVDPLRFRANLYVDGLDPWVETDWRDMQLQGPAGALFRTDGPIERCAAINVDPGTGERDLSLPRALMQAYGHMDMGVYLEVIADCRIATGDRVSVSSAA